MGSRQSQVGILLAPEEVGTGNKQDEGDWGCCTPGPTSKPRVETGVSHPWLSIAPGPRAHCAR